MMEGNTPFVMNVEPSGCGNGGMNGWGGDWIWIILVFALIWGNNGFGGFGGNGVQGALTRGDLCMDMNFNDLQNAVRSSAAENNANFRSVDNAICTLGYQNAQLVNGVQMQIGNEFRGLDNAVCTLGYNMQQGFNNTNLALLNGQNALSRQFADCCCEEQKAAMQARFDASQNTCATLQAIDKLGDRIEARMTAQELAQKDAIIADRDRQISYYQMLANNNAIKDGVVSDLRNCPIGTYAVANPNCCFDPYGIYTNYGRANNGCCGCNA